MGSRPWPLSLPRSSPGSYIGISDRFGSGGWATTPAEPGHAPIGVGPDVLPFHWLHYGVDRWRNPVSHSSVSYHVQLHVICCSRWVGPGANWIRYPVRWHGTSTSQSATEDRTASRLFLLTVGNSARHCCGYPIASTYVHMQVDCMLTVGNSCHHGRGYDGHGYPSNYGYFDHVWLNLSSAQDCALDIGNSSRHFHGYPDHIYGFVVDFIVRAVAMQSVLVNSLALCMRLHTNH